MDGIISAVGEVLNDNISTFEEFVSLTMPPVAMGYPVILKLMEVKKKEEIRILLGYQSKLLEKAIAQTDIVKKNDLLKVSLAVSRYIEKDSLEGKGYV